MMQTLPDDEDEVVIRARYPSREPGVWRWFASKNVVDLFRYRDGAELERIGRMLQHHYDPVLESARTATVIPWVR
jgi:hypothetical protein